MASSNGSKETLENGNEKEQEAGGEVSISFEIVAQESGPSDKSDNIVVDVQVEEVITPPENQPADDSQHTIQEKTSEDCNEEELSKYFIQKYNNACSRLESNDAVVQSQAQMKTSPLPGSSLSQGQSSRPCSCPIVTSHNFDCPNLGTSGIPNTSHFTSKFLSQNKPQSASYALPKMNCRENVHTPNTFFPSSQAKLFTQGIPTSNMTHSYCGTCNSSFSRPGHAHQFNLLGNKSCSNRCLGGSFENLRQVNHSRSGTSRCPVAGKSSCQLCLNDSPSASQFSDLQTSLKFIPDLSTSASRTAFPMVSSVLPKWRCDLEKQKSKKNAI